MPNIDVLERHLPPEEIHEAFLQDPDTYDYNTAYQPQYPDADALLDAIHELHATEPVTTPENIDAYRARLARIALGGAGCVNLSGRCNEPVDASMEICTLVNEAAIDMAAVEDGMRDAGVPEETIEESENNRRQAGQFGKPRTSATQRLSDGREVPSYMGDMVNGMDVNDRTPDPSRLVAAAVQARDLRAQMDEKAGRHVVVAHEALILPYDSSFVHVDPQTGKKYALSGDLLWIGERTNKRPVDGEVNHHVEMLSQIENPVGVKIGPKSDGEHIKWLADKLDPHRTPGKLIFMLRMGDDTEAIARVLDGIKEHAPNAIIQYDVHGSTVTDEDGAKVRAVEKVVSDIELLDDMARERGLRVRGLHLETSGTEDRTECVDTLGQKPEHKPVVDPLFRPSQLRKIIGAVATRLV